MNIVLFLNQDLASNLAYNQLKAALEPHNFWIYYSAAVGNPQAKPAVLKQLEAAEKNTLATLPALLKKHDIKTNFEFFNADFNTVPFTPCTDVNAPEFVEHLKALAPDLFISIRFGQIFKPDIIEVPTHGIINLHSGFLPDYRGILGTLHALKDQRPEVGCTLHTVPDNGIDTGDIIDTATLKVKAEKSLFWHVMNLYPLGVDLITDALKTIQAGQRLNTQPQDPNQGHYYSVPTEVDFKALEAAGIDVINKKDYQEVLLELMLADLNPAEKTNIKGLLNQGS